MVSRGGLRRMLEDDLLLSSLCEADTAPLTENERLCSRARWLRARARFAAVVSAEGASPNMKNLMKAPIRITTDSCPSRKPCVNDRLGLFSWVLEAWMVSLRGLLCWYLQRRV